MKEMMNSDKWIESDRNEKIFSHLDLLHISSHLVVHQSKPVSHIKFENSSSFGAFVHLRPTLPKTISRRLIEHERKHGRNVQDEWQQEL